ncbi:MAG: 4-alpha-glucanotransferase [Thermoleophilia bacterium]|nr:4-alpha-glucanotransferase [Thermoleophilia bacterium]
MTRGEGTEVAPSPLATSSPLVHGRAARAAAEAAAGGSAAGAATVPPGHRRAGVLLHVTSVPGPDGIGDLGAPARSFVSWLERAGQRVWQTLPLHPPASSAMDPYDAGSAFAGNPLLVSLDDLATDGLLPDTLEAMRSSVGAAAGAASEDPLARVARWKLPLVRQAARQLLSLPGDHALMREYLAFCEREAWWLADHVAFTAMCEQYPGVPRQEWPVEERVRRLGAHRARSLDIGATHQHPEAAVQFMFDRQLQALHAHAARHDVWLMTDAPIYPADDSADVWAHSELFILDGEHRASVRTGTPPDARRPAGEIWTMPAYDWAANAASGYDWWLRRLRHELRSADVVRIDQFRTFADWWSVPPRAAFAEQGRWEPGPGVPFVDAMRAAIGDRIVVVDDRGPSTPALQGLLSASDLPRSRVLLDGLDEGGASDQLPTSWSGTEVAYTSTATTDTVRGWADAAARAAAQDEDGRLAFALRFTGASEPAELPRAAIETVLRSSARLAIIPMQDWLGLGSDARMHAPGSGRPSWRWVAPAGAFTESLAAELAATSTRVARHGGG